MTIDEPGDEHRLLAAMGVDAQGERAVADAVDQHREDELVGEEARLHEVGLGMGRPEPDAAVADEGWCGRPSAPANQSSTTPLIMSK